MLRRYVPFAVDGFARTSALMSAFAFSASALLGERDLADAGVDDARLLDAVLDLAALRFARRPSSTSNVTVPTLGFGMRPRGPRTRPSLPTAPIMSGVAMTRSKSMKPSDTFCHQSSLPAKSAPASSASLLLLALGEDEHAHRLTGAVREDERAADHLVGVLGIDAQANGEVDRLVELGELRLLHERARLFDRVLARAVDDLLDLRRGSWTTSASASFSALAFELSPPTVTRDLPGGGSEV